MVHDILMMGVGVAGFLALKIVAKIIIVALDRRDVARHSKCRNSTVDDASERPWADREEIRKKILQEHDEIGKKIYAPHQ